MTSDDLANEHFGKSIFYKDESLWVDDFVKLRKGELWTRAIQNTRPIHCWYKQHPRLGRKLFKHVRAMRRDDDLSAAQSTQFEKEINEASLRTWMKGSLDLIDDYQSVIGNFLQCAGSGPALYLLQHLDETAKSLRTHAGEDRQVDFH